ncbi:hypothetical protein D0T50_10870 [Bacteroides sp. 214]|uniref:hypothetical protein n=1 Tax=Bacteroides sp. 214 TaxID=2302935 RepID=UPI0013D88D55|nr:hypothetical protein [Bacteroides sp. 214]NDW13391.1 hypothetical protein [Bacteroides sp. 214]
MKAIIYSLLAAFLFLACDSKAPSQTAYDTLNRSNKELAEKVRLLQDSLHQKHNSLQYTLGEAELLYLAGDSAGLAHIKTRLETDSLTTELIRVNEMLSNLSELQHDINSTDRLERQKFIDLLHQRKDINEEITWYENTFFTHTILHNFFSLYVGVSNNNVWMRLRMNYYGVEELSFFKTALLSDNIEIPIPFMDSRDKRTEFRGGYYCEWINIYVSHELLEKLRVIMNDKHIRMVFTGTTTYTYEITANEIKAMKEMVEAYDVLRAQFLPLP